jgi:acyl-CoA thioesterase I
MSIDPRRLLSRFACLPLAWFILACGDEERKPEPPADQREAEAAAPGRGRVLFLGTSLTAAYQLDPEQGFPALIQEKIDSAGLPFEAVNAGESGESAAGARSRLRWLLEQPVDVLVLETGANDMLRGAEVDSIRATLQAVIDTVRRVHPNAEIILAGMRATPNLGPAYVERFDSMYPELARRNGLRLIPFLLDGVAGQPELNLEDGIHPNPDGHRRLARTVWRTLEPVLRDRAARPPTPPGA